jgi:integrase
MKGGVAHFLLQILARLKKERIINMKFTNDKKLASDPRIHSYSTQQAKRCYRVSFKRTICGHQHRFEHAGFANKQAAIEWADNALRAVKLTNGKAQKVTVREYYAKWSQRNIADGTWSKDSIRNYQIMYKNFILPKYGDTPLDEINRDSFQAWVDQLIRPRANGKKGLSTSTLRMIKRMLSALLNDAILSELIVVNKIKRIRIPDGINKRNLAISREKYDEAIQAAEKILSDLQLGAFYLTLYGLRHSEILGLKFKHVHQDHVHICFTRTLACPEGQAKTKTDSSLRDVPISLKGSNIIKRAMAESKKIRLENNRKYDPDSFIFINSQGYPSGFSSLNNYFDTVSDAIGFHIFPHMMRHAFATFAVPLSDDRKDVANMMGHKNIEMTMAYDNGTKAGQRKIIKMMDI